jgi:AraC-like DNA-binding protein
MMALRFREAERLLLATDENISAIASCLGFATPAYFAECFRKRYGMPPRVFRERYRNQR